VDVIASISRLIVLFGFPSAEPSRSVAIVLLS